MTNRKDGEQPQTAVNPHPYWIEAPSEKICLDSTHPDVVAIGIISWEFAQLLNNRIYTSIDGSVEYHLYTTDRLRELVRKKDDKKTTKYVKKYKLKSRCEGSQVISMCFNPDLNQCEVISRVKIVVIDATDKFFKSQNKGRAGTLLEKNLPYEQLYKLNLIREAGLWKISRFEWDDEILVLK